ncbi:MAG: redoxin domain-containing protein [Candidatus Aenigmarchaeota archaeon]|nr:redoxin domain-containing protein [Candidatus Aenigmarchaeota archaeon]
MIKKSYAYVAVLILLAFFAGSFLANTAGSKDNGITGKATGSVVFEQAVGKKAPDFVLDGIDDKKTKLSDYAGKVVILFFNEGEMCYPACWQQIAALGSDGRFNTGDVAAFSIVVDSKSMWKKIVGQVPQLSEAKILFDTSKAVSSAYDVLSLESSMHPGSYPGHTYVVIDKGGVIRYVLDDPKMAIRNDQLALEIEKL